MSLDSVLVSSCLLIGVFGAKTFTSLRITTPHTTTHQFSLNLDYALKAHHMQATKLPPLFLYYTDLLKLFPHIKTTSGAFRRYQVMKKCLNKKNHQPITIKEAADWLDVPVADMVHAIQQ